MRLFRTEMWSYAVLLVVLLAMATLAVIKTVDYIEVELQPTDHQYNIVALLIGVVTMGFMLIAGAFGLWAIQFSAERESRRRIGRFVDAMDYLSDGLLAVDGRARITGSNPAARTLADGSLSGPRSLGDAFPCLSNEDVQILLDADEPREVEHRHPVGDTSLMLRFRSQPSEGLNLVMISDVTTIESQRERMRQAARLQLVGQLARGVAHDFNDLLCGIAGHASLLTHTDPRSEELRSSLETISRDAERGIALAGHLLELARSGIAGAATHNTGNHVRTAADLLRNTLPGTWNVDCRVEEALPSVALTGIQIEQVVFNLGLLAASPAGGGTLTIRVMRPGGEPGAKAGPNCAGLILIAAAPPSHASPASSAGSAPIGPASESGVIESVIRSLLMEAEGDLECHRSEPGHVVYRVLLPLGTVLVSPQRTGELPEQLKAYIAHWRVLVARPDEEHRPLAERMRELGITVHAAGSITSALAQIEEIDHLDAMVLDEYLLGQEIRPLLKAIVKLRPAAGILVLCDAPDRQPAELTSDIAFESNQAQPDTVLMSLIEARSLATRRQ